ncbi:MAG: SRPBCC family protein [Cyanobacteria bacterium REEB459]|nr:SRPBCC family protein [Cyanobacteria bacterium REEB459]
MASPGLAPSGPAQPQVSIRTESSGQHQRRILAATEIATSPERVWQVLTDYDNLASFIPNLSLSQRLRHPQGGIRLEQIGSQCFLSLRFCARVVIDMVEEFPHRLKFTLVEGDFRQFQGEWRLQSASTGLATYLSYELRLAPAWGMPIALIEGHICQDLTRNLQAIRDRALTL